MNIITVPHSQDFLLVPSWHICIGHWWLEKRAGAWQVTLHRNLMPVGKLLCWPSAPSPAASSSSNRFIFGFDWLSLGEIEGHDEIGHVRGSSRSGTVLTRSKELEAVNSSLAAVMLLILPKPRLPFRWLLGDERELSRHGKDLVYQHVRKPSTGASGYCFSENGEHELYSVGKAIAQAMYDLGTTDTTEPVSFTEEEVRDFPPPDAVAWVQIHITRQTDPEAWVGSPLVQRRTCCLARSSY